MACPSCGKQYVPTPVQVESPVVPSEVVQGQIVPVGNGFYQITPIRITQPSVAGHQVGVPEEVAIADLIKKEE